MSKFMIILTIISLTLTMGLWLKIPEFILSVTHSVTDILAVPSLLKDVWEVFPTEFTGFAVSLIAVSLSCTLFVALLHRG